MDDKNIDKKTNQTPDNNTDKNENNPKGVTTAQKIREGVKSVNDKIKRLKLNRVVLMIAVAVMVTIILFYGGLSAIFNFVLTLSVPDFVWIIVISSASSLITYFVMKKVIVSPLTKLEDAMTKVSHGDFTVRLETNSRIEEIKRSYDGFNMMVKELRSTEMLQSDFVANVSHEFKTPISTIEGYVTLLKGEVNTSDGEECVENILSSTKRLTSLIEGVLLLSKIENQSISPMLSAYRVDEQIRQAVVHLMDKWEKRGVLIDAELEEIVYLGNEKLLFHVWTNLIDNAVKFSERGKTVKLELKKEDGEIVFKVKDNGQGISESAKNHVFDKFYQVDNSRSKEGYGIGLALVKRIVTVYGGEVLVSDNTPKGTVFTVKLPIILES